jgi:hypothetical protein
MEDQETIPDEAGHLPQIQGSSVSYRIAVGPQQGRKAFMIRTLRLLDRPDPGLERVAKARLHPAAPLTALIPYHKVRN